VRVIKERVGGGYGSKQDITIEDLVAFCAWKTGRSVFQQYTREEEFVANSSRKPMRITVKLGAKKDGTFTAMYMNVESNQGAYGAHALTVPMNGVSKSLPLFLCENAAFNVTAYYSNRPPTGAYQGYGAPKANYAAAPAVTCGLGPALEQGFQMLEWGKAETSADPDVRIGKGFATIQQGSGLPGLDHATATVKMLGDGSFLVQSGGADIGTGLDLVSAKMTAEVLRCDMEQITVQSGDTDMAPFDTGAYASSGTSPVVPRETPRSNWRER
jgi:putative selenate reductase molybdopterin-binding subunit